MARVQDKADSVYDFLYIDLPRIQIFNSQFDQFGHITDLTRSTTASSSLGGGLDIKIAKTEASSGEQTSISKRYDTQFVTPLLFLDHAKDMIGRDIAKAGIGRFVLVSGALRILDLMMIKAAWDLKSVQKLVQTGARKSHSGEEGNRAQRRAQKNPGTSDDASEVIGLMIDMLKIMPHGLQGVLSSAPHTIWSALRAEGFVTPPSDLLLNHGLELTGTWNLVGILDATPDDADKVHVPETPTWDPAGAHSLVGNLATTLQPLARQFLGRPVKAYGVTPLLIFREVGS
ncbi:MAG: hypothetical protein ACLQUZ_01410 [Rhizomicrobium sp.]